MKKFVPFVREPLELPAQPATPPVTRTSPLPVQTPTPAPAPALKAAPAPVAQATITPFPAPVQAGVTRAPFGATGAHDPFWLGRRLVEAKRITPEQLASAIEEARRRPSEDFCRALERLSLASQATIASLMGSNYSLEVVSIQPGSLPATLVKRLPAVRARNALAVPYRDENGTLTIAVADPSRYTRHEAAEDFPSTLCAFVVAARDEILHAIDTAHSPPIVVSNPAELLTQILNDAVAKRASDVHFEQLPQSVEVRLRVDGDMVHHCNIAAEMKGAIVHAIKTFAKLDFAQVRLPQDGQGRHKVGATTWNCRISTIPTIRGENVDIRLQDESRNFGSLAELGVTQQRIDLLLRIIAQPNGIFYVTGPTGSGKTTLQYALLATQDTSSEKVITLEEPVEYQISSYTQISIDEKVGRTFAVMLRSILRHDPDIILVGETRDEETAKIAFNAALTGHRVFSTLHTNDAPSTIARLLELDVEPFVIASALKGVCATRLVPRLCESCRKPAARREYLCREYGEGDYYDAIGCPLCGDTGFRGRMAILEVYPLDGQETTDLILRKCTTTELAEHFAALGFKSMREDGLDKARLGLTTVQSVLLQTPAPSHNNTQKVG